MMYLNRRQIEVDEAIHSRPCQPVSLAPTFKYVVPVRADLETKCREPLPIRRHTKITDVPTDNALQPLSHLRNGVVHSLSKFGFHLTQLGSHSLPDSLANDRMLSVTPFPRTNVCEAKEVESFGLPLMPLLPVFDRKRTELQKPSFVGVQFQSKLFKAFDQFRPKSIGVRFKLESRQYRQPISRR